MIEITAGSRYMDIDAYASCIAYAKLLNSQGIEAMPVNTNAVYNKSIVKSFFKMPYKMFKPLQKKDKAIILDVSNPNMIDNDILKSNIIEVIDHHPYQEYIKYWNGRNASLLLEEIGSICTIIFEKIELANKIDILDTDLCKLLIAGIIDNTLNLKADITKKRDIIAYKKLLKIGNIKEQFVSKYLLECQKEIENNIFDSIEEDIKIDINYPPLPKNFGQLLISDIESILSKKDIIIKHMQKYDNWLINIINLSDGKSYILANDIETLTQINKALKGVINNNILILNKFMLRKEIMKKFTK